MWVVFARIACFRIEDDEELAGESDADDHQWLSGIAQPLVECLGSIMEAGRSSGDEEQNGTDRANVHHRWMRRPLRWALSLAIGARPTSVAMALPLQVPISGKSAIRRATVRPATAPKCHCDARTERMRPS
jgi:hypothetical protein